MRETIVPISGTQREYSSCICGCGRSTTRRFHSGCDGAFYGRLREAIRRGDQEAERLYLFMFKNNREGTFADQHRLARLWLNVQSDEQWAA